MSEENVEVARRGHDAFNRGDIEGVLADFAPDFEYVAAGAIPGVGGVHRGPDGYRRFMEAFWDEFDDACLMAHEFTEAGDQVLVSLTVRGRGKRSGAETTWTFWQLWTLRDGMVVRGQGFTDRDEALKAVRA